MISKNFIWVAVVDCCSKQIILLLGSCNILISDNIVWPGLTKGNSMFQPELSTRYALRIYKHML